MTQKIAVLGYFTAESEITSVLICVPVKCVWLAVVQGPEWLMGRLVAASVFPSY